MLHRFLLTLTIAGLAAITGCEGCRSSDRGAGPSGYVPTAEIIARHNRGVALMGQFDYAAAHGIFAELANAHPEWEAAQVDLAIATLNRRQEGDAERAKELLTRIIDQNPNNLRACYCRGILALDGGDPDVALMMFQRVAEADPSDGYAAYYTGQCLSQLGRSEEAIGWFVKAIEIDPYLRSAQYGAFQASLRLGDQGQADQYRELFQRLEANPQARVAEIKYTRMGPKAEVSSAIVETQPIVAPQGPLFLAVRSLPGVDVSLHHDAHRGPNLTVCDIDQDGFLDLFIASASADEQNANTVMFGGAAGFRVADSHPLGAVSAVNTAAWGDFDNDGATDVYLLREGPNQLWRQLADGDWINVTDSTDTGGADVNSVDGMFFDADHDGDLDLFVANHGPNELFNNNLDGTFRPLAVEQGIAGDAKTREVIATDFDHDRDVDLVVINQSPPHEVYQNNRLWHYEPALGFAELIGSELLTGVAVDRETDGRCELLTVSQTGLATWMADSEGVWRAKAVGSTSTDLQAPIAVTDVNGDGKPDVIVSTSDAWLVLELESGKELARQANTDPWRVANLEPARGPSIVAVAENAAPRIWQPGPGRFPFLSLRFTGKDDKADQMRSNRSGIGVQGAVRMGASWTAFHTFRSDSGPGQNLQPISIGTGALAEVDFVRMTWPDGVFQTEIGLTSGSEHRIEEDQRQVASCPVVFAWNGERHVFVTDVLGVAGIGFNTGNGQYGEPRPWENLLMPGDLLKPKQGHFEIKVGEPMEEACYLDAARLTSFDLPPGWQMVIDERFQVLGPPASGAPIYYRNEHLPIAASNDRGEDVLSQLHDADHVAAEPGPRDSRFLGLNAPHHVMLEFDTPLDRPNLYLMMDGWIEYPYSQTMFAAWQAGVTYDAPTVEAQDSDGKWHVLVEQFGYPAGMPRRAVLPINPSRMPKDARRLRIRTNVEIYWDRLAVIESESSREVRRQQLPLSTAFVDEVGFARRTTLAQRRPWYDYDRRDPLWDTRHLKGYYTSFGEATPLVAAIDDAVAIIGPGEEVHLEFVDQCGELPPGWSRQFVLELSGWCKDMDMYTRDGDTVGPLPLRDPDRAAQDRDLLHRKFNQRYRAGF